MIDSTATLEKQTQQRGFAEEIVEFCQQYPMTKHPYFVIIQQSPPNLTA
ncbi:MAG: hypothetical protein AB4426_16715 [Xenococcaceae cyanobacterium]